MAKILCPQCGSSNVARILWGMPAFTPALEEDLEQGKVVLGGCCIAEPTPKYHCKDCDEDIIYPFDVQLENTEYFEFQIGGFFCGFSRIMVERCGHVCTAAYAPGFANPEDATKIEIPEEMFFKFLKSVYNVGLWEWEDEYVDPDVLDGTQWTIRVRMQNQEEHEWYGSNAYPAVWKKFIRAVNRLPLPRIN